ADTHPVEGAFTFSVGAASATHVGATLPAPDDLVNDLFTVVRWLEYLCFALLGGGVAFLIVCWPDGGSRRGVGRLVMASSFGLFASTLLGLLLQGPYSQGTGLSQVFSPALVGSPGRPGRCSSRPWRRVGRSTTMPPPACKPRGASPTTSSTWTRRRCGSAA